MSSFSNTGLNSFPKPFCNEVWVDTGNGFGSTATSCKRYARIRRQLGKSITYIDDPVLGARFLINEPGLYAVCHQIGTNLGADAAAILLNRSVDDVAAVIESITFPDTILATSSSSFVNYTYSVNITTWLEAGSELTTTQHQIGTNPVTVSQVSMRITRIA